jgi:carbon-monoxide dehydrogenase small subunit
MIEKREITLTINGRNHGIRVDPRRTLVDAIRDDCGQTGTHIGCEHGVCGACTILLDGEPVRACLMFAVQAEGRQIRTVEGLANGDELSVLQQAFIDNHGLQCGFCTPGFVMSMTALLRDNPDPTDDEIREGLSGNFCRCTGYQGIVAAARRAAEMMRESVTHR